MAASTKGAAAGREAAPPAGDTIKVRATAVGFYGDVRRRIGDVFTIVLRTGTFSEVEQTKDGEPKLTKGTLLQHPITKEVEKTLSAEEQFNPKWMEKVDPATPERAASAQEVIDRDHDAILAARMSGGTAPTGNAEVLK
jgi:hypothetical protein